MMDGQPRERIKAHTPQIPPQLAYGNQKLPGIPKGSTLNFEVKLVSIN